jgi:carbonic anhydrase/acetyltransferase-like protein (isoleucine patch superfamily)
MHCRHVRAHDRNITAHSTALIAQDCDIRGTVSFGPGCVIHPRAIIHVLSPSAAIKFGKDCVVEEGAKIIHSYVSILFMSIADKQWGWSYGNW